MEAMAVLRRGWNDYWHDKKRFAQAAYLENNNRVRHEAVKLH
jgi:hypothetical protein